LSGGVAYGSWTCWVTGAIIAHLTINGVVWIGRVGAATLWRVLGIAVLTAKAANWRWWVIIQNTSAGRIKI